MCDFPLLVGNGVREWCPGSLVLNLKLLPSSTWVGVVVKGWGVLVPGEELKNIVIYIPPGGTGTQSHCCTIFLDYFSLVSVFPSFPVVV